MSASVTGNGIERIAAERQRQINEEGFSPEHDSEHVVGELEGAAAAYANVAAMCSAYYGMDVRNVQPVSPFWRWPSEWWKPSLDPVRNLEKAGALCAAAIDRLLAERAEESTQ